MDSLIRMTTEGTLYDTEVFSEKLEEGRRLGYDYAVAVEAAQKEAERHVAATTRWVNRTAADLERGDIFRFPSDGDGKASFCTAVHEHDSNALEVVFSSRDLTTGRPEGRSAVSRFSPVIILEA